MRIAVFSLLGLALASCGGGSTAEPLATTQEPPGSRAPARTQPAQGPDASHSAPRTTTRAGTPPPSRRRPRPSGGATPSAGVDAGAAEPAPGASPDVADEPATSAPAAPAPSRDDARSQQAEPEAAALLLDERAELTLTRRVSPSHYFQAGTVTGTYDGTMEVEARITSKGVLVRFTAILPGGTISGRGVAVAILDSTTWPSLRGTARVTGGTGRFAGIHGRRLKVTGRAKPDASRARVRLAGTVELN